MSRMESHGLAGEIQVTEETRRLVAAKYQLIERGVVDIKGKGPMALYLLQGRLGGPGAPASGKLG